MPGFSQVLQCIRHSVNYPGGPRSSSLPTSSLLPGASPTWPGMRQHAHPQPKEAAGE